MINECIAREMLAEFCGCDNDRPGDPNNSAIWVFGIEPGDSVWDRRERAKQLVEPSSSTPEPTTYSVERQLGWQFNQKAFKLLAAIEGRDVSTYREFAREKQPFVEGAEGYFKGNIYPYACNHVGEWPEEAAGEVGCGKEEYREWCNRHRVAVIHEWVRKYRPKVFIGVGTGFKEVFSRACFGTDVELTPVQVSGKTQVKTIYRHMDADTRLVVVPHFSGPNGLNCNKSIQEAGRVIGGMLS